MRVSKARARGSEHDRQKIRNLASPEIQLPWKEHSPWVRSAGGRYVWWGRVQKMLPGLPPMPTPGLCGVGLNLGLRPLLEAADKNLGKCPHSS